MYKSLLKVFLKENLSFRRMFQLGDKKSPSKMILMIAVLIYAVVVSIGSFGYLFFNLADIFDSIGLLYLILVYTFFYQIMLVFIFALFRSNGYIFQYKDYEVLSPLPIPARTVMFAKMTVMMIYVYFTTLVFTGPMFVAYFFYSGFTVIKGLNFLLLFLTTPLLPTILFSFLSLGVSMLTVRLRQTKIFSTILLFLLFLGMMYLSFSMNTSSENPFLGQQDFLLKFKDIYLPLVWYVKAVDESSILNMIYFVGINIIPFFLYLYAIQPLVRYTNQKGMNVITRKNKKVVINSQKSITRTIISKEFRRYVNSPIYIMNTAVGPIMGIGLGIASLFFKSSISSYIEPFLQTGFPIEFGLLAFLTFIMAMVYTSAISLSLEGKQFWIIKSLPIESYAIIKAKMIFNFIISAGSVLISAILLIISFQIEFYKAFMMIVYIISFSLLSSNIGSVINLYFPKLQFKNDTEVVKQSLAAIVAMLGNITFLALYAGLIYLLDSLIGYDWLLVIIISLNVFAFFIVNEYTKKMSHPLIYKMNA